VTEMSPPVILGRADELSAVERILRGAQSGQGGGLVIRGEIGIGKSVLLDAAAAAAGAFGMRVFRVAGLEAEMDIPFASLHQLLAPLVERVPRLPAPQRSALSSAFGLARPTTPDMLHVGLGALTLLSNAAAERPLMLAVDDAHCLDASSAEVLGLVSRRVAHERVALAFAIVDQGLSGPFAGLPRLDLTGLSDDAAQALVDGAVPGAFADSVRDRIVAESRGNPLALLELTEDLTADQLAGIAALPRTLPLGSTLERGVMRPVRRLRPDAQLFTLLAAAQPDGDADVIWRAAAELGLTLDAASQAERGGVLRNGPTITFRSAFTRPAIYGTASAVERRRVHRSLAAATDSPAGADARAWHQGMAAAEPDENVAAALELSARHVHDSPAFGSAATLLELASRLTPDATSRADRALAAVEEEFVAGGALRALAMLADATLSDDFQRARADRLRLQIAIEQGTAGDPTQRLFGVARALEPFDLRMARDAYLAALVAAVQSGRFGPPGGAAAAARIAQAAPRVAPGDETVGDLLLDGLARLFTHDHATAAPILRKAIGRLRTNGDFTWMRIGRLTACELWDDEALDDMTARLVELTRASGALFALRRALSARGAVYEVLAGRFDAAETLIEEAREIARATRNPRADDRSTPGRLLLAAWRGDEPEARRLAETTIREAAARGDGLEISFVHYALGVLELGLARYEAALRAGREVFANEVVWVTTWALPDLVEAAVRSDRPEEADEALERLTASTEASGTEWGLGLLARSKALVASKRDAPALYEEAIARLARSRATPQLARTRLLYGEMLRRARRRKDARIELRAASDAFAAMGADAFAERARNELAATGERAQRWTSQSMDVLTAQEARIARLVAEGATNADIAAQLFVSPRTVEYHLGKVFRKLGVGSRTQLTRALLDEREETPMND
jgi:DNA-binding CsgD family transcriptional regulator